MSCHYLYLSEDLPRVHRPGLSLLRRSGPTSTILWGASGWATRQESLRWVAQHVQSHVLHFQRRGWIQSFSLWLFANLVVVFLIGTFPTCRCFDILIGALSLVKIIPIVEKPDKLDTHVAFSFRRGKRLLSRYPPGHVAGIEMFFKFHKQRVDQDLQPKLIVSSLLGPPAEVWILRYDGWQDVPGWKQMPDDLKGYLARMLCVQFADTLKHANLKERWWLVTCHAWRTFFWNFAPTIFYMLYRSYVTVY